jgi:hypothetical protein
VGTIGDFNGGFMRRSVVAAVTGVLVVGASMVGSVAAQAAVPDVSSVALTMFQMPAGGDAPTAGEREFDSSNSTLTMSWSSGGNVAVAASAPDGTTASVSVGAGVGVDQFTLGYHAATSSPAEPGPASLGVAVDNTSCSGSGGIDVRDLVYSGATITRLDLVWAMYCGAVPGQVNEAGQFGEIQIGEPQSASVLLGSRVIEFSPVPVGALSKVVPVVFSNRGAKAVSVGTPSIGGSNPGAFAIAANTCGKTLAAHADCSISLRFGPHVPGARSANLAVTVGGIARSVELDATTFVGSSSFTAITGGGRVPGSGTNYSFTDANAVFVVGSGAGVTGSINAGSFLLKFAGPGNAMPQVGTYSTGANPVAGGPVVSVIGPGSGCDQLAGSFTVKQAVYTSYGLVGTLFPLHIDIVYSEHCVGGTNTMSGEFAYDAVAAITSPPPVTALSATGNATAVTVHWTNPTHTWAYTLIRVQASSGNDAAAQAVTGTPVYSGSGKTATIHGLTKGAAYTISAFTVDAYGNVTGPTETHITA